MRSWVKNSFKYVQNDATLINLVSNSIRQMSVAQMQGLIWKEI